MVGKYIVLKVKYKKIGGKATANSASIMYQQKEVNEYGDSSDSEEQKAEPLSKKFIDLTKVFSQCCYNTSTTASFNLMTGQQTNIRDPNCYQELQFFIRFFHMCHVFDKKPK